MDDRRRFPRFNLNVEVRWQKASSERTDGPSPNVGRTSNVSTGGACLVLTDTVQVGDVLELDLKLVGGKPIRLRGRVAWISKNVKIGEDRTVYECGVEFLDLTAEQREEIGKLFFNLPKTK